MGNSTFSGSGNPVILQYIPPSSVGNNRKEFLSKDKVKNKNSKAYNNYLK